MLNIRISLINFHRWSIYEYPSIEAAKLSQRGLGAYILKKRDDIYVVLKRTIVDIYIHNFIGLQFGNGDARIRIFARDEEDELRTAAGLVKEYNIIKKSYLKFCADLPEHQLYMSIAWVGKITIDDIIYDKFINDGGGKPALIMRDA